MSIKVEWDDVNATTEEYYVYRSATPILDSALPAPLATIPSGTKTYLDLAVSRNTMYYYRIGSKVGADINLSANKALAYVPYVGPGPQQIIRGNWDLGYFGRIPINDLFVPLDLQQIFGLGGGVYAPTNTMYWLKFAYKGKVIYVASHPLVINITWQSLYLAGLVYGNMPEANWPAYPKTTYGVVPQGKTLIRGQDQFVFRMPASRLVPGSTGSAAADLIGGEYDALIMAAYGITVNNFNPYRLDDVESMGTSFTSEFTSASGGACITRGTSGVTTPDSQSSSAASSTVATTTGWRPVLELVN